jgi:cytochrome c
MLSYLLGTCLITAVTTAFAADAPVLKRGESILVENCGPCHATARTGESRHPDAPPFRTLGKRYPIEYLQESLGEGIISGHPDMPEFTGDDVGAIIAYLKSIQQP